MNKKTACAIILIINLIFIDIFAVQSVKAEPLSGYTVRVGLVDLYSNQSQIVISNNDLTFGYETDGTYVAEGTISSDSGFTFVPDSTLYYRSSSSYASYNDAIAAINKANVSSDVLTVGIAGPNKYYVYSTGANVTTTITFVEFAVNVSYRMKLTWSSGSMVIDVIDVDKYPQFAAASADEAGVNVVNLGDRSYRGRIEIGRYGEASSLTAVSVVDMEEYLYGVVGCEMVPSWELEALKAQAVCARSYAYAIDDRSSAFGAKKGYALFDTTRSQVYKGYLSETEKTNKAVDETAGLMLYYKDSVVKAFFYSTSGGHSENAENVWDVALTYFRGVNDNTELHMEKAPWIVSKTKSELAAITDNSVGNVTNVSAQIRTEAGRIFTLKITGDAGNYTISKEKVRTSLSLPDTKAKIIKYGDVPDLVNIISRGQTAKKQISTSYIISGDGSISQASANLEQYIVISSDNLTNFPKSAPTSPDTYYFAGMGYGHGVGLSQSGAQSLALLGYDYQYILNHYYNKVEIK